MAEKPKNMFKLQRIQSFLPGPVNNTNDLITIHMSGKK
jgi:hypothetical protein